MNYGSQNFLLITTLRVSEPCSGTPAALSTTGSKGDSGSLYYFRNSISGRCASLQHFFEGGKLVEDSAEPYLSQMVFN